MPPTVLLLHGLARTSRSMAGMRKFLETNGFPTWAETYPSRLHTLEDLATQVAEQVQRDLPNQRYVAVTHSLGGILVRHLGERLPLEAAVMLAPPNAGTRAGLAFAQHPLYRWFYGPAGQQVVRPEAWPQAWPPFPVGVIAGTNSLSPVNPISWVTRALGILPAQEPSDGTVTVAETKHPQMHDFRTVDASHTWIMDHPQVQAWTLRFLQEGKFG